MNIKKKIMIFCGIFILLFLIASYFVNITVDSGSNYEVESKLLGALIFYKWYMLLIYVAVALSLIIWGVKSGRKK